MERAPATTLVDRLLVWYRANARTLPWREDPTPYAVLLSELMLQQTRVDTVITRFGQFLARWPTLADLAAADESEVVEAWAGLGYYRRARHLHRAAVAAHAAGGLPSDPAALRALPGVGPYTAGAIASIAFGVVTPLVDGNVERVLCRLDRVRTDPRKGEGKRAVWGRAGELVDAAAQAGHPPGDLNQALMELGALVCSPRAPSCASCPWAGVCRGRDIAERLPVRPPRRPPTPVRGVAGILRREGEVLQGLRHPHGLLGGLWEPVWTELSEGEPAEQGVARAFQQAAGLSVRPSAHLGSLVHVFTHRRLSLDVVAVDGPTPASPRAGPLYTALRWGGDTGLSTLANRALVVAAAPRPRQLGLLAADRRPPG